MTIFESVFLGILQGITEFLPISSDGHLVLAEKLLHIAMDPAMLQGFDITLHGGSLLALLLVYRHEWIRILSSPFTAERDTQKLLLLLIIASVPAAIAGFFLNDILPVLFRSTTVVGFSILATALIILFGEHAREKKNNKHLSVFEALLIGVAQAAALLPGLSRSGLTISTGLRLGLSRREALDFSFLMAAPIIFGAISLTGVSVLTGEIDLPDAQLVLSGLIAAFLSSLCAIQFLRRFVAGRSLNWFALYLIPVGLLIIIL